MKIYLPPFLSNCFDKGYKNLQQIELNSMEENNANSPDFRTVLINSPQHEKFSKNKVITAKYNVFTFIPKSLWEQFHIYSNCFFLFIVILQQIPGVSPTGRFTTAVPLSFILLVSMIKQLFEDLRLHKSDKITNNSLIYAFRHGSWMKVKWQDLTVGDMVKVSENKPFPADLVLLASSEPEGMSYIQTSNLDGETSLKIRQAPPLKALLANFSESKVPENATSENVTSEEKSSVNINTNNYSQFIASLRSVRGRIECAKPTRFLYDFTGTLRIQGAQPYPLNSDQLMLRGSQLKNTKWIIGVCVYTGHETKIMLNAMLPSFKRSSIDKMVNRQILILFVMLISLCLLSALGNTIFNHLRLEKDWYLGFSPSWYTANPNKVPRFIRRKLEKIQAETATSTIAANKFIPSPGQTSIGPQFFNGSFDPYHYYDHKPDEAEYMGGVGEWEDTLQHDGNITAERIGHIKDRFYSEMVTSNFGYIFLTFVILYNNLIPISLQVTVEVIRFFQAYFINVDSDMYDKETKMYATARTSSLNEELGEIKYVFSDKTGTLTRNEMEFKKCTIGGIIYGNQNEKDTVYEDPKFAEDLRNSTEQSKLMRQFLTVLAVCNTVIPLKSKSKTPSMQDPTAGLGGDQTDTANENDDVDGNQTRAKKKRKKACGCLPTSSKDLVNICPELAPCFRMSVETENGGQTTTSASDTEPENSAGKGSEKTKNGGQKQTTSSDGRAILSSATATTTTTNGGKAKRDELYQGSSPDECAMVDGANKLGYSLVHREGPHKVTINVGDQMLDFEILAVLDFNSDRKRMDVIVRCPQGYLDIIPKEIKAVSTPSGMEKKNSVEPINGIQNIDLKNGSQENNNNSNPQQPQNENFYGAQNTNNNNNNENENLDSGKNGKNNTDSSMQKNDQSKSNNMPPNDPSNSQSTNANVQKQENSKSNGQNTPKDGGKGQLLLMCKGADSEVYNRVGTSPECSKYKDQTMQDLEIFALQGLRTLCIAVAPIDETFFEGWHKEYQEAKLAIKDREKRIDEVFAKIEKDFILIGSTAIEDKLQEGVPECLTKLAQAGIKTWVLTGDKQATAINIGYSCALLTQDTPLLVINENNEEAIGNALRMYKEQLGDRVRKDNRLALIIDGKSLKFALGSAVQQDFLDVILSCQTIICCRTTPLQKSEVVQLIRSHTPYSTLAIGDGSNDVAMIHAAHVGVGISGKEGLQAANSSDFSISQFRFLTKLLLVHGAWNHSRMCKLILYQFYKNICMYIMELWFAMVSYFSGQPLFERWTLGLYNVAFTVLPPAAIGLFDRTVSAESCLKFPVLYTEAQKGEVFDVRVFWLWIGNAVFHSLCIFWLTFLMQRNDVVWHNGRTGDYLVLGNFIYTYVVIVVCLKSGLVTYSWTIMTQLAIWGSILVWMIFLIPYSFLWPKIPIAPEMCGQVTLIYSSSVFWLGIIIIPFMTLFPDLVTKIFQRTLCPSLIEKVREYEIAHQDPTDLITKATKKTIYWILSTFMSTLSVLDDQEDKRLGKPIGTTYSMRLAGLPLSLQNHLRKLYQKHRTPPPPDPKALPGVTLNGKTKDTTNKQSLVNSPPNLLLTSPLPNALTADENISKINSKNTNEKIGEKPIVESNAILPQSNGNIVNNNVSTILPNNNIDKNIENEAIGINNVKKGDKPPPLPSIITALPDGLLPDLNELDSKKNGKPQKTFDQMLLETPVPGKSANLKNGDVAQQSGSNNNATETNKNGKNGNIFTFAGTDNTLLNQSSKPGSELNISNISKDQNQPTVNAKNGKKPDSPNNTNEQSKTTTTSNKETNEEEYELKENNRL